MSAKNEHGLTSQQEAFAQAVASGLNQSDAYRKAYPKSKKWKDSAVWAQSSALTNNSKVSERVASLQAASAEIAVLDGAKIMEEYRRLAHSDIAGIMNPDGSVKLPHELDPVTRSAIASFKIDEYGRIEYKFWNKNAALTDAAKIKGLFREDNEQSRPVTKIVMVPKKRASGE